MDLNFLQESSTTRNQSENLKLPVTIYRYQSYDFQSESQNFVCGNKVSDDFESSYIKLGLDKSDSNKEMLTLGYAFEGRLVLPAAVNLLTNAILRRQLLDQSIA